MNKEGSEAVTICNRLEYINKDIEVLG